MKLSSKVVLSSVLALFLTAAAFAEWKPVKLDSTHSRIGFTASTLLFDVSGAFHKYDVMVDGDPSQPTTAKVLVNVEAASIDTGVEKRDEHLKSHDFLDVKSYPKISFSSDNITQSGNQLNVSGTLDLHGQKKKVTIPFKMVRGKNGAGVDTVAYRGKLTIDRKTYGIGASSVAAKISLEDDIVLDLLLVTFP